MHKLLLLLCVACSTVSNDPSPIPSTSLASGDTVYMRNLSMTVNGRHGVGVMTVPVSSRYEIKIDLPNKAEVLFLTNCHREQLVEKSGWFNRSSHTFVILPNPGIETGTGRKCPILIEALDVGGSNAWGVIEIDNEELPATVYCNGVSEASGGVSICQSRNGLLQRILFDEATDYAIEKTSCPEPQALKSGKGYDIKVGRDFCTYNFLGLSSKRIHRFSNFGYNSVFLQSLKPENQK